MTVIAFAALWSHPLYIVRGGVFPVVELIKSGQQILAIVIEGCGYRGYPANQRPFFGAAFVGIRIETDEEKFLLVRILEIGKSFPVKAHMTAVAVGVRLGVADITGDQVLVNSVLLDIRVRFMAVAALGQILDVVTVPVIGPAVAVKILLRMAFHAVHVMFRVVDIPLAGFTCELVADSTSVTGGALVGLIRLFVEFVPVDKAALRGVGSADVAFAAAGMTAETVVVHPFVQKGELIGIRSRPPVDHWFVGCEGIVKRGAGQLCLCLVTFPAGGGGIGKGGVCHHPDMGFCHLRRFRVSTMAFGTADLAMIGLEKTWINQHFLMQLQRSYGAASTLSSCFS